MYPERASFQVIHEGCYSFAEVRYVRRVSGLSVQQIKHHTHTSRGYLEEMKNVQST